MAALAGGAATRRRRVFDLLDVGSSEPTGRIIDAVLICLIVANVAAAIADSVPSLSERYGGLFHAVELVSVALFTLEYAVRMWCVPEMPGFEDDPPWRSRIRYAVTPSALIDLVSVAPVYAAYLTDIDVRALLILRLFRFFKLARYSPGLESLFEALVAERRALTACAVILFGVVLIAATAMNLAEGDAQPDKLGTIPDAMYWAFVTLTTVGYGDVVPVTPLGKVVASMTAVVGIGMLALPVGILASSFADEIRRRDFVVTLTMVAKVPLFAELGASEVAGIMRCLHARSVEAGQAVVQKGDRADAMYFISAGSCEVDLGSRAVRLETGDFFGEIGLLQGRERSATVSAVSRARLLVLESHDLKVLMERSPAMARRIQDVAAARDRERASTAAPNS